MSERHEPRPNGLVAFRVLAIAAVFAAVGQVTLGGVVRVTGSGLGCPDWPLCHGRIVPPADAAALIEYSHRASASVLGLLVLALAVVALRSYRSDMWTLVPAVLAAGLVFVAAALGGLTVWTELEWWLRLLHLAVAQSIVACLAFVLVAAWGSRRDRAPAETGDSRLDILLFGSVAGVFALMLYGSYMVGVGYGSACATWPLCGGTILPLDEPYVVHMLHRFMAALVGLVVAATALLAWVNAGQRRSVRWAAGALVVLFLAQALLGAATVWAGFSPLLRSIHLGFATAVWLALALLAGVLLVPRRLVFRATRRVVGLDGAVP